MEVPVTATECVSQREAESKGWIQKGTDKVFGSTEGLVGAIVGGLIGNQVGGGSGKKIATVAGVVIGNQVGNSGSKQASNSGQQYCRDIIKHYIRVEQVNVIGHYNVTVDVNGRPVTVKRQSDPGKTISINVE